MSDDTTVNFTIPSSMEITNWPASQTVTGPLTDAELRATAVPVSGTFWQATQPVSGTFWQTTQPVSGPLTNAELRATPVTTYPWDMAVASGAITGVTPWSKIGINLAISTTELDLAPWMTAIYAWPSTELTMTIVSDSVEDDVEKADTNPGTGAHTVTVYYLDDAFAEKSVTVNMNGTSAVTIAEDMYRVQNVRVATTGTSNRAVGNITIASGGITYGYISATKTRQRQAIWTVPAGKTLYITQISFSCSDQAASKYCRFTTRANYDNKSGLILQRGMFMPYNEITLNNSSYIKTLNPPTKLPATVDLKVSAISNSAAAGTCSLSGYLVTN